jgi:hypothetical protein
MALLGHGALEQAFPLLADCVAKQFSAPEREIMIQDRAQMRNVDSRTQSPRFDCYKIQFNSARAATFATQSAQMRPRRMSAVESASGYEAENICSR